MVNKLILFRNLQVGQIKYKFSNSDFVLRTTVAVSLFRHLKEYAFKPHFVVKLTASKLCKSLVNPSPAAFSKASL